LRRLRGLQEQLGRLADLALCRDRIDKLLDEGDLPKVCRRPLKETLELIALERREPLDAFRKSWGELRTFWRLFRPVESLPGEDGR
jgi:CHAD domain-containing protein